MRRGRAALIAWALFILPVFAGCVPGGDAPPATTPAPPPPSGPVANAGLDQGNIAPGTVMTLDGSRSTSPSGRPLTYSWTFFSIPGGSAAVLANPGTVSPTFTVDRAGDYIAQLIVNDGIVDSDPAQVKISTNQVAPVADAGPNQAVIRNALVTLDGSRSSDGNGDPLTYTWSLTTRPAGSTAALANATTVHPTFIVDQLGNYTAQLIVNDGHVNSRAAEVTISTSNVAPVANAGPNQTVGPGTPVTLDGSGSTDANRDPLTYSWSLLSIPTGSAAILANATTVHPTFTVDRAGDYIAQLIVNDGVVDSAPATVRISTSNVAPVANAGPNRTVLPGTLVTLDGSQSTDANGDPLTYSWSLLSKPANSGSVVLTNPGTVHPTFTVDRQAGDYIVQLIVNDGTVNSAPVTVTIT
ncbi:MAG TPA: PKD domain-containing protein, partial [Nitrospira sp.]|nr:PKD domain-containing protein [Nitrospira sp.]